MADRIALAVDVGSSSIRCSAYRVPTNDDRGCSGAGDGPRASAVGGHGCISSFRARIVDPGTGYVRLRLDAADNDGGGGGGAGSGPMALPLLDAIDSCVDGTLERLRDHYRESAGEGGSGAAASVAVTVAAAATEEEEEEGDSGVQGGGDCGDEEEVVAVAVAAVRVPCRGGGPILSRNESDRDSD